MYGDESYGSDRYRLMYGCRGGTGFIPKSLAISREGGMR